MCGCPNLEPDRAGWPDRSVVRCRRSGAAVKCAPANRSWPSNATVAASLHPSREVIRASLTNKGRRFAAGRPAGRNRPCYRLVKQGELKQPVAAVRCLANDRNLVAANRCERCREPGRQGRQCLCREPCSSARDQQHVPVTCDDHRTGAVTDRAGRLDPGKSLRIKRRPARIIVYLDRRTVALEHNGPAPQNQQRRRRTVALQLGEGGRLYRRHVVRRCCWRGEDGQPKQARPEQSTDLSGHRRCSPAAATTAFARSIAGRSIICPSNAKAPCPRSSAAWAAASRRWA